MQPSGPTTSKVLVMTDYPEKGDFNQGKIFSAKHGWLYKKMLESVPGGHFNKQYITSLSFNQLEPPTPVWKNSKKLASYVQEHRRNGDEINAEIANVNPNVIISVGEASLNYLTKLEGVKKFQGSILSLTTSFNLPNVKVVPIQHPRDIYKVYSAFYYTPIYLKKALQFENDPLPFKETLHIEVVNNFQAVSNYFRSHRDAPFIVADIETWFNLISCIGISLSPDSAIVIPFLEDGTSIFELCEILKLVQKGFNHWPYVNQNAVFDHIRVERFGFKLKEVLGDTMLNMSAIYPELPKNLGFLNSLWTNIPYFKDENKGYIPSKQLYFYCGKDCISTNQIFRAQMKDAEELGVATFITQHLMRYYPVYKEMNTIGLQVDVNVRDSLITKYTLMGQCFTGEIKEILGYDINPLSSKQCIKLLYDELRLPVQNKRRVDGNSSPSADENSIEFLLLNYVDNQEIKNLLEKIVYVRKIDRILGYLQIPLHEGDILRSSFNLAGTETGRSSTSKSGDNFYYELACKDGQNILKYRELGTAFQTIPKHGFEMSDGVRIGADIRKMFVPRPGYIFCEGDQAKAEAVIVTVLAKDWDLYNTFYDINLHKVTARAVFGLSSDAEVTEDQYNKGKRVRHAANYDMGVDTLAQQALCSRTEASVILSKFHSECWRIRGIFQADVRNFVTRNMYLNNPYGRRRDFFVNPNDKNWIREAYAHIPQSTVAEKTKIGMYKTKDVLDKKNIDFHYLGESHDSVLAEVREGQEYDYMQTLKQYMEEPIDMRKCCISRDIQAVIKFECAKGYNWKDLKGVELT